MTKTRYSLHKTKAEELLSYFPLVSIVIPVYNTARFLGECLDSICKQNYKKIEVICVDDGSTDSSPEIIQFYVRKDRRIKYIRQENQGQSVARNLGMSYATGEYICFVDSDDFIIPNAIFQSVEIFKKHKVDVVLFNMEMFLPDGRHFPCFSGKWYTSHQPIISSSKSEISINFTNAAAGIYKRKFLIDKQIYFPEGMIYEDWVFMARLMTQDIRFFWLDSPLYWYRRDFMLSTTSNVTRKCLDLFQAYHLSNTMLNQINDGRKKQFINDGKILNESIGFLESRLLECQNKDLVHEFITHIIRIFEEFPNAYFFQLCNEISDSRKKIAHTIYQNRKELYNKEKTISYVFKWRKRAQLSRQKQRFILLFKIFVNRLKGLLKSLMRELMPAYRVSSSIRAELEVFMLETRNSQRVIENRINQIKIATLKKGRDDSHKEIQP